jgi:hypothetical protein
MKIKLTEEWRQEDNSFNRIARCNNMHLVCKSVWPDGRHIKYLGFVTLVGQQPLSITRYGKPKSHRKSAMNEAEKLAIELLEDIINGAKKLAEQCGVLED